MAAVAVTTEQLAQLAKMEAANRKLELDIIQRKARFLITNMEQMLSRNTAEAAKFRNELLEQQAEFVKENGKAGSNEYVQIRQKNSWDYDESQVLTKLKADPRLQQYIVTTVSERIDKNEFKKQLARLSLDELNELGVKYTEGYSTDFRPLGDLE